MKTGAYTCRLVTKASEDVQQGRHYNKTLEDLDRNLLIRYGGGASSTRDDDEEEEEEEGGEKVHDEQVEQGVEEEEAAAPPPSEVRAKGGDKSERQQALEAEWGLYRSPAISQHSPEEDDGDTDDGRNHDSPDLDEEDFMVS